MYGVPYDKEVVSETIAASSVNSIEPTALDYAPPRGDSLGRSAVRNSLWTIGSYAIFNVVRLVGNVVVTYYLAREWIGVMAIVNTVLIGIRLFSDVGIGPAVVTNRRGTEENFLRTAFATQIFRGFAIWIAACLAALPVTYIYQREDKIYSILFTLLPIAGFVAVIEGFRSTNIFRLQRRLDLRKNAILEVVEVIVTTTIMIVWARIHPTVWALLIPSMVGTAVTTVLSHFLLRDRFDWPQWHSDCAKEMMRIGRWVFLSTALTFFASQFERLMFGKLVDPATLAVYWIAVNLATMPFAAISKLGSTVLFPTFSRVAHDNQRFADVYGRARTMLLLAGSVFICGIIAASPFAIRMLYKSDYDEAGLMLQLLSLSIWFQIIDTTNVAGLLSRQRAHWMVSGNAIKVVLMFAFVPVVFHQFNASHGMIAGFSAALVALGLADACRAIVGTVGLIRDGVPWRSLKADFVLPPLILVVGLIAFYSTAHFAPGIEAHFPTTKMGRRLASFLLFSIAAAQVLAVFAPLIYFAWQRTRRAQIISE